MCFIIFYKSTAIESKIKRICDAFSANRYDLSNLNQTQELDKQQQDNHREMAEVQNFSIAYHYCNVFSFFMYVRYFVIPYSNFNASDGFLI